MGSRYVALIKSLEVLVHAVLISQPLSLWCLGTLPQEDPGIKIQKYPSQFVFPDDEMVFELELSNLGVGTEASFALFSDLNANEGNMDISVDGGPFSILSGTSIKKTLTIRKGPRMYVNKAVPLTLESACMGDAR